jgi:hypothetical protein
MKMQGRTEEKQEEGLKQNKEMKEKMNKMEEGHKAQHCSLHYPDSRVVPNSMCGQNAQFLHVNAQVVQTLTTELSHTHIM